ncbi:MAG: nucleotide exchange factor GrpE [Crocinitomicaceae bacterium]|nr:nucleotide exchange factor GrpE [Crocinitomicaceae bacterium]
MSEEKEMNDTNQEETLDQVNQDAVENSEETTETVKSEPTAEERYAELNDKYLRLYSEYDNYRKRTNKERIELIGSASESVLKDLLPIMDDFERAILYNETAEDLEAIKQGMKLIYEKFKSTLANKGLVALEAKGQPFDSEFHEAIANVPAPDKKMIGKVVDDVEKGYLLNDKVIRYAKVVVGQ